MPLSLNKCLKYSSRRSPRTKSSNQTILHQYNTRRVHCSSPRTQPSCIRRPDALDAPTPPITTSTLTLRSSSTPIPRILCFGQQTDFHIRDKARQPLGLGWRSPYRSGLSGRVHAAAPGAGARVLPPQLCRHTGRHTP